MSAFTAFKSAVRPVTAQLSRVYFLAAPGGDIYGAEDVRSAHERALTLGATGVYQIGNGERPISTEDLDLFRDHFVYQLTASASNTFGVFTKAKPLVCIAGLGVKENDSHGLRLSTQDSKRLLSTGSFLRRLLRPLKVPVNVVLMSSYGHALMPGIASCLLPHSSFLTFSQQGLIESKTDPVGVFAKAVWASSGDSSATASPYSAAESWTDMEAPLPFLRISSSRQAERQAESPSDLFAARCP